jgi:hypothetical protein
MVDGLRVAVPAGSDGPLWARSATPTDAFSRRHPGRCPSDLGHPRPRGGATETASGGRGSPRKRGEPERSGDSPRFQELRQKIWSFRGPRPWLSPSWRWRPPGSSAWMNHAVCGRPSAARSLAFAVLALAEGGAALTMRFARLPACRYYACCQVEGRRCPAPRAALRVP